MKRKPRTRRRAPSSSHAAIYRRMREIWIDGFGLLPRGASLEEISHLRTALTKIAADEDYWNGLATLCALRRDANRLMEFLKNEPPARTRKRPQRPRSKGVKK